MKKSLLLGSLVAGSLTFGNTVAVAQQVFEFAQPSGTTHFTTYFSLDAAHVVEMVDNSSITVAELVGITVNPDGEPHFDNMVVHCLVSIRVVKGEQDLYGACKETDKDGDYDFHDFRQQGSLLHRRHRQVPGDYRGGAVHGRDPACTGRGSSGAFIIPHEVTWKLE